MSISALIVSPISKKSEHKSGPSISNTRKKETPIIEIIIMQISKKYAQEIGRIITKGKNQNARQRKGRV